MFYSTTTFPITINVETSYNRSNSNSDSTYYNYTVEFLNASNDLYEIVGRELTVRPNTLGESKDITLNTLSKEVRGKVIDKEYTYHTFSANNGPVSLRGYYLLKNLTTNEVLEVKFPLTFFPMIGYTEY